MDRRTFIGTLAGALLAAPLAAEGQQARRQWRVGFLGDGERTSIAPFREGLWERGYIEGENLVIDERWTEDHSERLLALAGELVRLNVDVIVAAGVRGIQAAQAATLTIPIVMAVVPDPVSAGLVASLARPGGNTTGLTDQVPELSAKEIQILREVLPRL
jgi:ABC-type uncharacterized transport system substrate-binding protein